MARTERDRELQRGESFAVIVDDYALEIERVNEALKSASKDSPITDKDSYEKLYIEIINRGEPFKNSKHKDFFNKAFKAYRITNPGVSAERKNRGQKELSKRDLDGFVGTGKGGSKKRFIHLAIRSGKVVHAERVFITRLGKTRPVFRDKSGCFCSPKPPNLKTFNKKNTKKFKK